MKKIVFMLLITLLTANSSICEAAEKMRGVWVATAANLDYPSAAGLCAEELRAEADTVLDNCRDMGFNAVFLQVRPSGDALYPDSVYPWSRYISGEEGIAPEGGLDPLAYWIQAAHSRNMELHAWINPYRVANDASVKLAKSNPARLFPEWTVNYNGGLYMDPGNPDVKNLIIDGVKEIINNYDTDGIHFDDYFYPGKDFDDSESYKKYGAGMNIGDWRRSNTEALVKETHEAILSCGKDISFGVSPCGIWANDFDMPNGSATSGAGAYCDMYADTLKWAMEGYVDYIAPQIYWYAGFEAADYDTLCEWWQSQLGECETKLYIGLGDYRVTEHGDDKKSPWYEGNEIISQMQKNAAADGIDGEIHFRYSSAAENSVLRDKIRDEYSRQGSREYDSGAKREREGSLYIYFDKFGHPIFTKLSDEDFSTEHCREYAPTNADYVFGFSFADGKSERKTTVRL